MSIPFSLVGQGRRRQYNLSPATRVSDFMRRVREEFSIGIEPGKILKCVLVDADLQGEAANFSKIEISEDEVHTLADRGFMADTEYTLTHLFVGGTRGSLARR